MLSAKFKIFKICKRFLQNDCDMSKIPQEENNFESFKTYLIKDENNTYNISDNQFSIKCIFEKKFLEEFLSANENIEMNNLNDFPLNIQKFDIDILTVIDEKSYIILNLVLYIREFELVNDIDVDNCQLCVNINRNNDIYNLLRRYFGKITSIITSQDDISINFHAGIFDDLKIGSYQEKEILGENSHITFFDIYQTSNKNRAFLMNESLDLQNSMCYLEHILEPLVLSEKKDFNDLNFQDEELKKLLLMDYRSIFNKQPTQLKNLNNNLKIKENKVEMENLMQVEDVELNTNNEVKEENDSQLLNKKRKHSEENNELRKELIEKMPNDIKNIILKYKTSSFNISLFEKYRFYKKYGSLNVKLLK